MRSARAAALHALTALAKGRVDRVREGLDAAQVEPREQALANELAHGVVRRERLLDHILGGYAHRGLPKDPQLHVALRLGAYQLLFTHGMPARAAVHETVELVRNNRGFANALLRRIADAIELRPADPERPTSELAMTPTQTFVLPKPLPDDLVARLAILHSLPDALLQRWAARFTPAELERIAVAASAVPPICLRPAGCDAQTLAQRLAREHVATAPAADPRLLRWSGGSSPFATTAFRDGAFVVQDPTAFAAADAVPCRPGDTVIDLCAAPGTKTTWLAERVRPGGRVVAFDPDPVRRQRIVDNATRLGLADVVTVVAETSARPPAECVLADVPCSNSGVLGRRVEVRRRIDEQAIRELAALQRELLAQAIGLTKPGGACVYSTCSIDAEENEQVVAAVLGDAAVARCVVERQELTLPVAGERDGGFFAVLRRGGT